MKFAAAAAAAASSAILLSSQATALATKRTSILVLLKPGNYRCGLSTYFTSTVPSSSSYNLVAMASAVMDQFGSAQNNELCGMTIEITNPNGVSEQAVIADTAGADIIDMCLALWEGFGGVDGDGTQMTGMEWRLV